MQLNKDNTSDNNNAALAVAPTAAGFMLDSADDSDGTGTYAFDGISDIFRIMEFKRRPRPKIILRRAWYSVI